jgi:lysophospholipid acyltransferase 1/2
MLACVVVVYFCSPLMMIVQRVSYVAFAYHDGVHRKKEELSEDQDKHKIISLPTLLEYLSYNVSFLTILTGPTLTFNEYDDFISGKNFSSTIEDPSSLIPTVKTLLGSLVFVVIYALSSSRLSRDLILSPDISFIERLINITIFCFISRCMYYFTFLIVESSCNAAGLGYSGLDDKGNEKWDLARNIDILSFELGTNARQVISSWNIRTTIWIRRVIYERILWNQVIIANLASAFWHGFYPGYYLSFIIVGVATIAARKV